MIIPAAIRGAVLDDPGGDALDSIIAAWATVPATRARQRLNEPVKPPYDVEGYVYV